LRASCKAGQRHGLDQRNHHIAGARGQIDHQVIQLAPVHLLQKLADDLVQHRPAHHQRLVPGRNVADGNGLDAVRQVGLDAVVRAHRGRLRRTHHQGNVGAVDVGVDQAHPLAHAGKRNGQVDGDRGLAHAALAGTDGDNL
jgi:hypothetical protein